MKRFVIRNSFLLTMKLSVRFTVILIPLVVAVVCAWVASSRRSQQAMAIEHYRRALNTGFDAGPNGLVAAYGVERVRELMMSYSGVSPDVVFDGSDRWVQILRVPFAHGVDQGDGYMLYSLHGGVPRIWTLPEGSVLQSVKFVDEQVIFRVYGRIKQGSFQYTIPEDNPAEYRIQWKRGAPVPQTNVGELLSKEFCVEQNRMY